MPLLAVLPSAGLAASAACCLGDDDGPLVAYSPEVIADGLRARLQLRIGIASDGPPAVPSRVDLAKLLAGDMLPAVIVTAGFASGTSDLTAQGMLNLDAVADALSRPELNRYTVLIVGYADDAGLSQGTAQAVVDYLVSARDMEVTRLVPYGLPGPVTTSDPMVEDRRIQVVLLE
jgi:hypothetical protein